MLKIWTDGSCLGNPGPGGWAFIATDGKNVAERSGGEKDTTNNRMELTAVIRALTAAKKHDELELHTDSQYVKNGMEKWVQQWKNNNWKNAERKPVKNKELWQQLDQLAQTKRIKWVWVKGHEVQDRNEGGDTFAQTAAEEIK